MYTAFIFPRVEQITKSNYSSLPPSMCYCHHRGWWKTKSVKKKVKSYLQNCLQAIPYSNEILWLIYMVYLNLTLHVLAQLQNLNRKFTFTFVVFTTIRTTVEFFCKVCDANRIPIILPKKNVLKFWYSALMDSYLPKSIVTDSRNFAFVLTAPIRTIQAWVVCP